MPWNGLILETIRVFAFSEKSFEKLLNLCIINNVLISFWKLVSIKLCNDFLFFFLIIDEYVI